MKIKFKEKMYKLKEAIKENSYYRLKIALISSVIVAATITAIVLLVIKYAKYANYA